MAQFDTFGETEKKAFLKKYKSCAEAGVLVVIWQAKVTNATKLSLTRKKISDLSPLKDLKNLKTLYVVHTQVSDLSPLKDLQNLQELSISETQVSDLSPLKDLQNLQEL